MEQINELELKAATLRRVMALEMEKRLLDIRIKDVLDTVLDEAGLTGEWKVENNKLVRVVTQDESNPS